METSWQFYVGSGFGTFVGLIGISYIPSVSGPSKCVRAKFALMKKMLLSLVPISILPLHDKFIVQWKKDWRQSQVVISIIAD